MTKKQIQSYTEISGVSPFLVFLSGQNRGQFVALDEHVMGFANLGDRHVNVIAPSDS